MKFLKISLPIVVLSLIACGKKTESGNTASASLALANSTSLGLDLTASVTCPSGSGYNSSTKCYTPSSYGIKMLNVIVSPDASGATSAPAGLIWINPSCPVSSQESEIDKKKFT